MDITKLFVILHPCFFQMYIDPNTKANGYPTSTNANPNVLGSLNVAQQTPKENKMTKGVATKTLTDCSTQ